MKTKLRNVTVTLEEHVVQWAHAEATRKKISVSRLLGAILKERMIEDEAYESAMRRALARKPFFNSKGGFLTREETHR